jgi:hypothetical protein
MLVLVAALAAGCADQKSEPAAAGSAVSEAAAADGAKYMLASEPAGAQDVLAVRESAKDGDPVVIAGRIGGDHSPWVDGVAAFSIVDSSLKACNEIPGDSCPTPWDYCCESNLNAKKALIKVVDAQGQTVGTDARQLLNLKELQTVVVSGKAQRDDAGNLTVLAESVYVKK